MQIIDFSALTVRMRKVKTLSAQDKIRNKEFAEEIKNILETKKTKLLK